MKWNFRVVRHEDRSGDLWYGIHEVYYGQNDEPRAHSARAEPVMSETHDGLRWVLTEMLKALDKDVMEEIPEKELPF